MNFRKMIEESPYYDQMLISSNIEDREKRIEELKEDRDDMLSIVGTTDIKSTDSKLEVIAKNDILEIDQILKEVS